MYSKKKQKPTISIEQLIETVQYLFFIRKVGLYMIKRIYESNNGTPQEAANMALNDAKQIFRDIMDDNIDKQELLVDATHLIQVLKELCKLLETKKENYFGRVRSRKSMRENYGESDLVIDMWYGDEFNKYEHGADATFYPNEGVYRGNIYDKNGKIIGDYSCSDSVVLQKELGIIFR